MKEQIVGMLVLVVRGDNAVVFTYYMYLAHKLGLLWFDLFKLKRKEYEE